MRSLRTPGLLAAVLVLAGACASDPGAAVGEGIASVVNDVEDWMGGGDLPSEHLQRLREVHEPGTWRLRTDVDGALETARTSVRALGESDMATWRDAGIVIQVVSSVATDHSASIVRVEALDTLARLAPWTFQSESEPEFEATEDAVIDALKIVREAQGRQDADAKFTAEVLHAVRVLGAYRFDAVKAARADVSLPTVARLYSGKLRNARGVLMAFTGSTLEGFRGDPEIRDAMDRAYVSLSGAVLRASFATALTGDPVETVRTTAAQHLGALRPAGAADELARSLRQDLSSSVRRSAAIALGGFPVEQAVPALIEGLYDDMPDVRGAAAHALGVATGEHFGLDRSAWRTWWQQRAKAPPTESAAE